MKTVKHIVWPAVLLIATTTVGFAQPKAYNGSPKSDFKQEKYDRCNRKHKDWDKCDHDKDHRGDRGYDRDDHDRKDYRDNSQSSSQPTNNS